jgi:hypothetical protein
MHESFGRQLKGYVNIYFKRQTVANISVLMDGIEKTDESKQHRIQIKQNRR